MWGSLIQLGWLASELQALAWLCFPGDGITGIDFTDS